MKILGISAFYHDSAACVIVDGEIIAAAQEERFTRKKHDAAFPSNAVKFCLQKSNLTIAELDAVVFYDKPFLKFERLLETYYSFAPKGLISFLSAVPVWAKEKMFLKKLLLDELTEIEALERNKIKLLFPEHHLSHAASAYYPSAFNDAAILTIDGVGEWTTASIAHGKGNEITILKELHFPHSLGLFYSAFTYFLGFRVNSGEYKLMGLAPYGISHSEETQRFKKIIKEHLIDIKEDGSIWLNQKYYNYATGLTMVPDKQWEQLFGFAKRNAESEPEQHHCNLALAVQEVTEEVFLKMAKEASRLTQSENICLAGGVALNCVANGKLQQAGIFKNIFIQPAAGDAGGAMGAALAAHYIYFNNERNITAEKDQLKGSYLGNECAVEAIEKTIATYKASYIKYTTEKEMCNSVAEILAKGNVVGWVQGSMEFGPRALGARSILGDARNADMQKKLNLKIKYRESFRPFAPAVLAEDVQEYFEIDSASPYMLMVAPVKKERRSPLPENYDTLDLKSKLYQQRSDIPAVTHVDFSARIQTVHQETNPVFYQLLQSFKQLTGYSLLVNTSFNVRGEPIVCTAEDAYRCFMRTDMDYLVIDNYLFSKKDQPEWKEKDDWKVILTID
jgi:carbamoyltransferase